MPINRIRNIYRSIVNNKDLWNNWILNEKWFENQTQWILNKIASIDIQKVRIKNWIQHFIKNHVNNAKLSCKWWWFIVTFNNPDYIYIQNDIDCFLHQCYSCINYLLRLVWQYVIDEDITSWIWEFHRKVYYSKACPEFNVIYDKYKKSIESFNKYRKVVTHHEYLSYWEQIDIYVTAPNHIKSIYIDLNQLWFENWKTNLESRLNDVQDSISKFSVNTFERIEKDIRTI